MTKKLTATQLKALSVLADGKERQVYECGSTNTVESLEARDLIDWRPSERKHFGSSPGYALVKITEAGLVELRRVPCTECGYPLLSNGHFAACGAPAGSLAGAVPVPQ